MLNKDRICQLIITFIAVGVCFIIFLPLVVNSNFFFPFIVFKNVLFRIAVEIIFAAYLVLALLDPDYRFRRQDKITWAILSFFGISLLAGIFGIGWYRSFWGNYERMSGIFHHLHLVLYFLVLINVFKHKKNWHSFFTFSIFGSILMSFLGWAQWLQVPFLMKSAGGERLTGTIGNPTFLAAYLLFNLFFILYFLPNEKKFNLKLFCWSFWIFDAYLVLSGILYTLFSAGGWGILNFFKTPLLIKSLGYPGLFYPFLIFQALIVLVWFFKTDVNMIRILLAVSFFFEFLIFFNTQTRGAILGFIIGLVVFLMAALFLSANKRIKKLSSIGFIIILFLPILLFLLKNTNFVQNIGTLNRLSRISIHDITTESRLLTWQASFRGWTETPKSFLIGYGPDNYYYAFNKNFPVKIFKDQGSQIWFDQAHNIVFDVAVTTGIIGLLAYLALFIFIVLALIKRYRQTGVLNSSWLFISLAVAYFIQNFFVFDTLNVEVLFYLFLAFVVFLTQRPSEIKEASNFKINYVYISLVSIILLFSLVINVRTLQANNYLFQALVAGTTTDSSNVKAFSLYEKAINQSVTGKFEARQQMANFVAKLLDNKQALNPQVSRVVLELKKSISDEPLNINHYIFLSTFYNKISHFKDSIGLIQNSLYLSPSRPQIYFVLGQAYLLDNNIDQAIEQYRKAVALAPWVAASRWNLIYLAAYVDREDIAGEEIAFLKSINAWVQPQDYYTLIDVYAQVGNNGKITQIYQKLIELYPDQSKYHIDLAKFYAKIGREVAAENEINEAVRLDPNLSIQAEAFLESLRQGKLLKE